MMTEDVISDNSRRFLDASEEPNRWLTPIEGYEEKPLVSLEESVQRLKKLIDDNQTKILVEEIHIQNFLAVLDRNIWLAKNNSSNFQGDLSLDESAAIHLYTMQWSDSDDNLCTILNKILRAEERNILKPWFSYLKLILTALFKLPSKKGIVWRGIRGNVTDQYQLEKVWWGFSSCTETMGQIDQFLGRCGKRTIFMIDCINGKAIRHHSKFPEENEILLMPGCFLRVIDKHSPAEDLYIIHLQETTAPYELLRPPFKSDPSSIVPLPIPDVGISFKDATSILPTTIESHETAIAIEAETAMEIEMDSRQIETYRLFYVNHDHSLDDEAYRITNDCQNMSTVIRALHQFNPGQDQLFGIYGDKVALKTCLQSFFPNNHIQINSMFTKIDLMPAIWAVYNNMKFVFLLIPIHDASSEKGNYLMTIMQRYLQDICRNILICPSDESFSNFSTEHPFHGKSLETRTYRQVKIERIKPEMLQKVTLNDKNILKTLLNEQSGHILTTNNTPNTYCLQKILPKPTQSALDSRYNKLKQLLQTHLSITTVDVDLVSKLCKQYGISLSETQRSQIENIVLNFLSIYNNEKLAIMNEAKALINELFGTGSYFAYLIGNSIDEIFKKQLHDETTDWLINPVHIGENATQFVARLITTISTYKLSKNRRIDLDHQRLGRFISGLQTSDKKTKMYQLKTILIQDIYVTVTSGNQSEIHYDIQQLYYNPVNDTENRLQCLTVICSTPVQISLNDLILFLNISVLSESDRLDFSRQTEFVACFKMNDGKCDIIIIKRPNIINKKLSPTSGYTVLLHKSRVFRKVLDFYLPNIYFAYAFNQNSHTLVLYRADNGNVTRCPLDEFGRSQNTFVLLPLDQSKKPNGVKSLALTVAQDLLILIDSSSAVYAIDITNEDRVNISLLIKNIDTSGDKPDFVDANGDFYETVQTIGEKNPFFFFQSKSCIDIIDKTYCQIHSIKLEQHSPLYKMQIFTDFINTYCVLFNANTNEVHCIRNLVSDTCIERRESLGNLDKSAKQCTGNRLLDIIKRGELQFGVPDSSDKTQYYFVLSPEYFTYSDRIQKYFEDLKVTGQLKIGYETSDLIYSVLDIEQLIKVLVNRVPLKLCAIEMGTLVPLNNGRRNKIDHLPSELFRIEIKAQEISFSYLDNLLNGINENIKVIGIIGHQSTGKSYLMNKIFRTRFTVVAGRCTDGIWMSYAFLEKTHFIILNCEGLFSDQQTEDEEIKLISFLAAVCDITILSQNLGFYRFQDRLFGALSQATDKIPNSDKLFKGILIVAVCDVNDYNPNESFDAVEEKFLDLPRKGKSGFLKQLFSDTFKIQLLHHFQNKNFDSDIQKLRQLIFKHAMEDEVTGLQLPCRWKNGKELADRLKILLVQLYTDDFTDSDEIQADMKIAVLEQEMKRAWTTFHLNDEENIELHQQKIETKFKDKPCSLKLNHLELELDENSSGRNFDNVCELILNQLHSIIGFSDETKEEMNKIYSFVNELILEVMNYRREQVKQLMLERFQKEFPNERKTKFMNFMEEYMLSFKVELCLKKCSKCHLKCIMNAQHTKETKFLLENKKNELARVQDCFKAIASKNIEERFKKLNEDYFAAKTRKYDFRKKMVHLANELKYLSEKENLEATIRQYESDLAVKKTNIDNLTQRIMEIHQQLKNLLLLKDELANISELSHRLNADIKQLVNADQYKVDDLNKLSEKFHQNYKTDYRYKNKKLLCFSSEQEYTTKAESTSDFELNISLSFKTMTDNANNVCNYRQFIQQCLERIKGQRNTEQQHLENSKTHIKEIEQEIVNVEKQKEDITKSIEITKIEYEKIDKQLSAINVEQEAISKELNEVNQLIETIWSYDQQIESVHIKLSKETEKKNTKEEYIKKLKTEELDDVEDEENILKKLNKRIEDIQVTLTDLQEKKTSACNNSTLSMKILNDPQYNIYEYQKNKQNRLIELTECSKQLNENIKQLQQSLFSEENRLKKQNEVISKNEQDLDLKKAEHEIHMNNVKDNTRLIEVGTELLQSLSEVETSLIAALEKLNKISEAQNLIKEHTSLSNALTLSTNEQNRLDGLREDLNQQLEAKKKDASISHYMNTQACKKQYDIIAKDYDNIHSQTKKLEQEWSDLNVYLGLKNEIAHLEIEDQRYCNCQTDHKCSGICQICLEEDKTKQNKCMFAAGHAGDHKCDAGHVCRNFCQICEIYGFPMRRCCFSYEHIKPTYHQCECFHQCPAKCVCSELCAIPLEIKPHNIHRCSQTNCCKSCMFTCGHLCAIEDHNHDTNAETVAIDIGNEIHHMKKHLCNQPHRCKGICNAPGICKREYREELRKWKTESGTEFAYNHIKVEAVRAICGMKIDVGKSAHDETKNHVCGGQHTCTERCPDCGSFCSYLFGHSGKHKTNHRNKDQHIFTSINPAERSEIFSNIQETRVRPYTIGESVKLENCSVSCKRRGRSHIHLTECPGGSECSENVLANEVKHSNDTYYYGPDIPSAKKYDQILCSTYWSRHKWFSPVDNDADRKLIDSCNTYCVNHVERDKNGLIVKDSSKGFCTLDAWHIGNHVFECQMDHHTFLMYQGIDICFVIDTASSMAPYCEKVKLTIARIMIENESLLKNIKSTCNFRFAIVDYRDHEPKEDYIYRKCDFTNNKAASDYVQNLTFADGGDPSEAVLDGLDAACELKWGDNFDRLLFHILDAPPHGRIYDTFSSNKWPVGCPCGKTAQIVLQKMKNKKISYNVLHYSDSLNLMISEFKKYINVKTLTFDDKITFEDVIVKQVQQQLIDTEMIVKNT